MSSAMLPGDKMQVFAFDDDYSFGVLQALPHVLWYQAKAARLKKPRTSRARYSARCPGEFPQT
jgi:hypothetical protein